MSTTQVRFPASHAQVLKACAALEDKTLSEYLGDLVEADRKKKGVPIFTPKTQTAA